VNSPLLFLSHAGVDTDAARALKARLLAAPDTLAAGLRVWFDKDDLRAGEPWVHQLEEAIRHRSTAFAVYVGSRGVVNWVNAEVQLALGRAVTDTSYRFIPILAPQALQAEALPGFVALYQGVANVEGSPEAFAKLVAAVLGGDPAGMARLEAEPFFGLKAVDEARAHLFFGREVESEALVQLLANEALVMVTGDSGSGKSSLARAGLLPRWRGGVLAEITGARAGEVVWHVVQTQPRSRPFAALAEAVGEAAKQLGLSLADRGTLESWVRGADVEQVRRALWCDLPPDRTRVLLLVDQFEELVTIADPAQREPFVRLLLALADPRDPRARVVLTMRRDYYNLLSQFPALFERLETNNRRARYLVGRMKDEGLRRVVTEPLRLAGVPEGDREALARSVLRDAGDRPGDLALVQMALTEAWDHRHSVGDDLLRAYANAGGVEGAIAKAAEDVYEHVLSDAERLLAEAVFVRLVRLGDTGGATRRLSARAEFDEARWRLVQRLAGADGKRLVLVRGGEGSETAEIAHEALVTQWPRYQTWLSGRDPEGRDRAADKRVLDALIQRTLDWATAPDATAKLRRQASGADLDAFVRLAKQRPAWLSTNEQRLVLESRRAAIAQRYQERQRIRDLNTALAKARASLIWSQLEFADEDDLQVHEVEALWELSSAGPRIRTAFLEQLGGSYSLLLKFAKRPEVVLRALGVALTGEQAQALLDRLLEAFSAAADPMALWPLARAVRALRIRLDDDQARRLLDHLRAAFMQAGSTHDVEALGDVAQQLAFTSGPQAALEAFDVLVKGASGFSNPRMVRNIASIMRQFPIACPARQGPHEFAELLEDTLIQAVDPIDAELLLVVLNAGEFCAVTFEPASIRRALECALTAIAHAPSPQQLADLTNVLSKLPIELDSNQIQAALDRIVRMIGGSKDIETLDKLVDAAQNLIPKLDVTQAGVLLKVLLDILKAQATQRASRGADLDASMLNWGIAHTFTDLVPRLDEDQIQPLLASLLKMLKGAKEERADVIVAIVAALGSRLTDDQARQSLDAILDAFPRFATSELSGMRDLGALAHRLSVDAASGALARITRMTNEYEQGGALLALVQLVSRLPIEPGPELIEPVVTRVARALTSESDAYALCEGLAALAPSFDERRANAALRSVFDVLSKSPDTYGRRAAARFMGTAAPRLNAQDRARALQAALAGLAMSPGADEAIDWATALEALIADMTEEPYIQWIISALKYPNCALETDNSPIAASVKREASGRHAKPANATEVLVDRLLSRVGKTEQGMKLEGLRQWVAESFPTIDVERPPTRPPALAQVLASVGSNVLP
jgi:hypothetical protein